MWSVPTPVAPEAPPPGISRDDRIFAMLSHLGQMFGSFVIPLVIFLMKRNSRFVSFHALQALIAQLIFIVCWIVGFLGFFALIFASIPTQPGPHNEPPRAFFLFPFMWIGMFGLYGVMWVMALVYSYLAYDGRWTKYPIIGRLAEKWSAHESQIPDAINP
jgi:uncharacterized membrane protein